MGNDCGPDQTGAGRDFPTKPTPGHPSHADPLFDQAWEIYPKRNGGNPKLTARKAWNARIRQNIDPQTMLDGVRRYGVWCQTNGKIGTEYVLQAATFFGPEHRFVEEWSGTGKDDPLNLSGMDYSKGIDLNGKF